MTSHLESELKKAIASKSVPAIGAVALDKSGNELYKVAYGTVNAGDENAPAFTTDTPMLIWSCTKLVTSVAILQLVEQGKLSLDEPVEKYVPSINENKVLHGWDENDQPILRDPVEKITVLNLITHTSGLCYDFFDKDTLKWRIGIGEEPAQYVAVSARANYKSPLRHEPGKGWTYGPNIEFLGWIIESISGLGLNEYFQKHICEPLGMKDTGLKRPAGKDHLVVHFKGEDGKLAPVPAVWFPENPEVVAGGHFLTSTLEEYAQFLVTLLNGTHPKTGVKILEEATVKKYLFTDFLPQICTNKDVGIIGHSIPQLSNEGEFFPGVSKGWSCGLLLNHEDLESGRPKGSGAWAGLGNVYYWLDRAGGKIGIIGSAVLPFFDPDVLHLFDAFERSMYGREPSKGPGAPGSNFVVTKAIHVH